VTVDLPLAGRTVMVTRPRAQAQDLATSLRERGARVLVAPAIRIVAAPRTALDRAARDVAGGRYRWVVLTSRSGVEAVLGRLQAMGLGPEAVRAAVAAVGEGTAEALRVHGIQPAVVPGEFTTAALGAAMPRGTGAVLLARADIAPDGLEQALERKGWQPVRVDAYRTEFARRLPAAAERALRDGTVDAVTFTSASTVEGFAALAGGALAAAPHPPRVVCIGPVTARAARRAGFRVHRTASPHTIEGLVAAVDRALARGPRSGRSG
jgi:uroporphyrinogen-III synthase